MLQQTTVATVTPRFERFVARWPTVEALAAARGRGHPRRVGGARLLRPRPQPDRLRARDCAARRLSRTAPPSCGRLPGIGAYTSAAIAAIAFGEQAAAVDTNVQRVIARLHGSKSRRAAEIERLALDMMPADRPGDFVQAMMDLGATICRPRNRAAANARSRPIARPSPAASPKAFPSGGSAPPARTARRRLLDRARRIGLAGAPAGEGPARRHGCASGQRLDRCAAGAVERDRHRPPCLHPFLARPCRRARAEPDGEGWWQPLDRLDEAGCRRSIAAPRSWLCRARQRRLKLARSRPLRGGANPSISASANTGTLHGRPFQHHCRLGAVRRIVALGSSIVAGEISMPSGPKRWAIRSPAWRRKARAAPPPSSRSKSISPRPTPPRASRSSTSARPATTPTRAAPTSLGPNLWGVLGEPIGQGKGFAFSDALSKKGGNWNWDNLSQWLTSPKAFAPGHQDDLRRPRQSRGPRQRHRLPQFA